MPRTTRSSGARTSPDPSSPPARSSNRKKAAAAGQPKAKVSKGKAAGGGGGAGGAKGKGKSKEEGEAGLTAAEKATLLKLQKKAGMQAEKAERLAGKCSTLSECERINYLYHQRYGSDPRRSWKRKRTRRTRRMPCPLRRNPRVGRS